MEKIFVKRQVLQFPFQVLKWQIYKLSIFGRVLIADRCHVNFLDIHCSLPHFGCMHHVIRNFTKLSISELFLYFYIFILIFNLFITINYYFIIMTMIRGWKKRKKRKERKETSFLESCLFQILSKRMNVFQSIKFLTTR